MGLTEREKDILDVIRQFITERGYSPSISDVAAPLLMSKSVAYQHVKALERKGVIVRDPGEARSIRLAETVRDSP